MHEMQTIVTDVRGVCQTSSVSLSVTWLNSRRVRGHSVQLLPNHFGLLFANFFHFSHFVYTLSCGLVYGFLACVLTVGFDYSVGYYSAFDYRLNFCIIVI